jgi:hypothetical protein
MSKRSIFPPDQEHQAGRISVLFQALDSRINVKAAVEAENASYSCLLHDSHV